MLLDELSVSLQLQNEKQHMKFHISNSKIRVGSKFSFVNLICGMVVGWGFIEGAEGVFRRYFFVEIRRKGDCYLGVIEHS